MSLALVYKSTGNWYSIKNEQGQLIQAQLRGKFRNQNIKHTNPIAVGDWVEYELLPDKTARITAIQTRGNYLIRKSVNLSKSTHILAANIDLLFLMVTLANPKTSTGFIDRILVTAEAYHISTCLLFNKIDEQDLVQQKQMETLKKLYECIGYECIPISAKNKINLGLIQEKMKNKTNLISGHSGVGKSTLLNALHPDLNVKTAEVSGYNDKGKHTTTHAQMFDLPFGGQLIDTPGIKEFGLVEIELNELQAYFPEIFAQKPNCKFHNCLHKNEPKCAVKLAVENGSIAKSRYQSYLNFLDEFAT